MTKFQLNLCTFLFSTYIIIARPTINMAVDIFLQLTIMCVFYNFWKYKL